MTEKACPVCGGPLAALEFGTGTVWRCGAHGVKDWWFDLASWDRPREKDGPVLEPDVEVLRRPASVLRP